MNKDILLKYLNNSCSGEEFEQFVEWMENNASFKEGKEWGFEEWKTCQPDLKAGEEVRFSALLDRIHHGINLKKEGNKKMAAFPIASWFNKAAAILFIPLLGFLFYMISYSYLKPDRLAGQVDNSIEVIAPIGSRTVVQLSDGSVAHLNYGSALKYPQFFTADHREVILEGEGFFEVAHNPDKPFVVKSGKLNVRATGTRFNVQAYSGEDYISTTLIDGTVVLEECSRTGEIRTLGKMVPGQHLQYNLQTGTFQSSVVNAYNHIAWTEGKLVFDNEPITKVAERLSRMYAVDIELDENIRDITYTVTFGDEPLFLILDLMKETAPITYKTLPRKKLDDGTYSKQKIIIEKKN